MASSGQRRQPRRGRLGPVLWLWACAGALLAAGASPAETSFIPIDAGDDLPTFRESWERFHAGWDALFDWRFVTVQLLEFAIAIGLAALIAFHPRNYRRAFVAHLDLVDQPKTLLIYAMVAAMVAEIVQIYPAMAFVVFGIGGLLRFRTDLGLPKLTGRAILVTIIGLAVGLELFPLAVIGTVVGWILIYALERLAVIEVRIRKIPHDRVWEATDAWEAIFEEVGGHVVTATPNQSNGQVTFVVLVQASTDRDRLRDLAERMPEELRAKVDLVVA